MSKFEEYANKYKHIKMERRDGILQFTIHNNGRPVNHTATPPMPSVTLRATATTRS
jgi:hypothetical protein